MATGGTQAPSGGRKHPRHGGHKKGRHHISDFPFPDITLPPAGMFDPGLAAQIRQSQRGLLDTEQDVRRGIHQARVDTGLGRKEARRQTRYSIGDIQFQRHTAKQSFARDLQDLAIAQQRGDQDYQIALSNLTRKYANLASNQAQTANARGILGEGGFAAAASAQRASNRAFEQRPIDISHARLGENIGLKRTRAREDIGLKLGRYGVLAHRTRADLHQQLRQLHLNLRRTLQQNRTRRSRAIREQGLYALDQASQAYYAAHQLHPTVRFPSLQQLRTGNVNPHGHTLG